MTKGRKPGAFQSPRNVAISADTGRRVLKSESKENLGRAERCRGGSSPPYPPGPIVGASLSRNPIATVAPYRLGEACASPHNREVSMPACGSWASAIAARSGMFGRQADAPRLSLDSRISGWDRAYDPTEGAAVQVCVYATRSSNPQMYGFGRVRKEGQARLGC